MSEMAQWSTPTASASSAVLRRGRGDGELELRLYLGLNSDARGSAWWSEAWWSYVRELSKNGMAVVALELGGNGTTLYGFARARRGRERCRARRVRACEEGGRVAAIFLPMSA